MRDELTPAELDFEFYGAKPVVVAEFYDTEVLDQMASKAAGHRVEKKAIYVHVVCEREGSENRRPMQTIDKQRYPAEWNRYQEAHREPQDIPDIRTEAPCVGIGEGYAQAKGS